MRVQGVVQRDVFRVAHNLHTAGQKNLKKELDKASRQAGEVIAKEVQDHTKDYIPANFERRFDTAFKAKVEVRLVASRRITIVFWARGKTVNRDIKAINAGKLKHPIYGRMRRLTAGGIHVPDAHRNRIVGSHYKNPWVSSPPQAIRPGLVDEPARRATPKARQKIEDALDRVSQQIVKGS